VVALLCCFQAACTGTEKPGDVHAADAVRADADASSTDAAVDGRSDAREPDAGLPKCAWTPSGAATAGRFERFESAAVIPTGDLNPFDPEQVDIRGIFEDAQGQAVEMPAFYYAGFERKLSESGETLVPAGEPEWRVRFTPGTVGGWRWKWTARVGGSECGTDWQHLDVGEASPGRHGFVRVSTGDSRYLAFDDATPYVPVGENMAWYDGQGTFAYDDWMEKLAGSGGNYIRIWMASWGFGLEAMEGDQAFLGRYRLDRAWKLDQVLERADELGIRVMLCLQYHGQLSEEVNSEWPLNPYNAVNRGPLDDPLDFFTDEEARRLVRQRLRYIVARWGYSPALLAWELWNEVDYTFQLDAAIQVAWHREMAEELHRLDPNGHLVTTSTSTLGGVFGLWDALFAMPEMDLVQYHLYGGDGLTPDFTSTIPKAVAAAGKLGKPVLIGEAGVDFNGPAETLAADPDFTGFRDILWAGLLSGSAGTGMTWWWDNVVDPKNAYPLFQPVADILAGVDPATAGFVPVSVDIEPNLRLLALASDDLVLGWVKNLDDLWYLGGDPAPTGPVLLPLDLAQGTWTVTWIATHDAPVPEPSELVAAGGETALELPPFSRDVAFRLDRMPLEQ